MIGQAMSRIKNRIKYYLNVNNSKNIVDYNCCKYIQLLRIGVKVRFKLLKNIYQIF
jgi:hypothetical protein